MYVLKDLKPRCLQHLGTLATVLTGTTKQNSHLPAPRSPMVVVLAMPAGVQLGDCEPGGQAGCPSSKHPLMGQVLHKVGGRRDR